MKLTTLLQTGMVGLGLATATLLPGKAEAQLTGNVEYIQSEVNEASYTRGNFFYGLHGDIKGFTFMELNQDGSYLGRTILNREISNGIGPRVIARHIGEPLLDVGVGVSAVVPKLPENVFATVGLLPLWFGNEGRPIGDKVYAQYFFSADLPLGLNLSGFGDIDLIGENGVAWSYGEFGLTKKFGSFFAGYNPVLLGNGKDFMPKRQDRATIGVRFE